MWDDVDDDDEEEEAMMIDNVSDGWMAVVVRSYCDEILFVN